MFATTHLLLMAIIFVLIGAIALPSAIGCLGWWWMLDRLAKAGVKRYYGEADKEKEVL